MAAAVEALAMEDGLPLEETAPAREEVAATYLAPATGHLTSAPPTVGAQAVI